MNGGLKLLNEFFNNFTKKDKLIVCPQYPLLNKASRSLNISAQNCNENKVGSFTGEVSAELLKEMGCSYVLLGHSERRNIFKETNVQILKKVKVAQECGLKPIVCVGSNFKSIKDDKAFIKRQIKGLNSEVFIAYEPVWSIGSDEIPTLSYIDDIIYWIKKETEVTNVFYGGSVNSENGKNISKICDGLLVGRAGLSVNSIIKLLKLF